MLKENTLFKQLLLKMKTIYFLFLFLFLVSFTTAINIEAGDSYKIDLGEIPAYYEVTNNFDVEVTYNGTIVSITPGKYMEGDFTITFYNEKDEPIKSSGGSGSGICYRGWKTTEWADCLNDKQIRNVTRDRYGECYQTKQEEPAKEKDCEIIKDEEPVEEVEDSKNKTYWIIIIVAGIGLLLIIWVLISKG